MKEHKSILAKNTLIILSITILILIALFASARKNEENDGLKIIYNTGNALPINNTAGGGDKGISIIKYPISIKGRCGEWKTFEIELKNEDTFPRKPVVQIPNVNHLKFLYPKKFILPPGSIKEMTFLVNFYCDDTDEKIPANITIDDNLAEIIFSAQKWK
jgi:hypothetical protein